MATIAELVERGIRLLDANGPKDWRAKISVDELEMSEPCGCILGQLFGEFYEGKIALGIVSGRDFGFDAIPSNDPTDDYAQLHQEWTRRLTEPTCPAS